MGDIFESELEDEEAIAALEDEDTTRIPEDTIETTEFTRPLFRLRLDYSGETFWTLCPRNMTLKAGDKVLIPTRYGKDIARVIGECEKPHGVLRRDLVEIDRLATQKDIDHVDELKVKEKDAYDLFKERVAARKLDMKIITVHFLPDDQKALFFFTADTRIDFRELVKDLVAVFKLRIELRQVNARDEARITGGIGICGRKFCCHGVSDKLTPVCIKMAKDQNFSLNSMKISGACGRLLCCLAYESDWYAAIKHSLPSIGLTIYCKGVAYKIIDVNPVSTKVKMVGDDGSLLEFEASDFTKEGGRWKLLPEAVEAMDEDNSEELIEEGETDYDSNQ